MRFAFIARHRGIWSVAWLCSALDLSRSGFHAWLNRSPSVRSRHDEILVSGIDRKQTLRLTKQEVVVAPFRDIPRASPKLQIALRPVSLPFPLSSHAAIGDAFLVATKEGSHHKERTRSRGRKFV